MKKRRKVSIFSIALIALLMVCCANPSDPNDPGEVFEVGHFIDGPVKGLTYTTSSGKTGITDEYGKFEFRTGDTVNFSLGNSSLGAAVPTADVITPLDLFGAISIDQSTEATNLVRLLLALDTGDNPFGLTLPEALQNSSAADMDSLLGLDSAAFVTAAQNFISGVTGVDSSTISIPTEAEALDHFELSQKLIDTINSGNQDDNVFLTIQIPDGKSGFVSISYTLDNLPAGINSYVSGTSRSIDLDTSSISFSEFLYKANWIFTISQLEDQTQLQVGDILSFYHSDGFRPTLPTGFPLSVGDDDIILQADLDLHGGVVQEVQVVSGYIEVPKLLPDGTDFKNTVDSSSSFALFVDILEIDAALWAKSLANIAVHPLFGNSADWTEVGDNYQIEYTTTLPTGFNIRGQIYLLSGDYDLVCHRAAGELLNEDKTEYNFLGGEWGTVNQFSIRSSKGMNILSEDGDIIKSQF